LHGRVQSDASAALGIVNRTGAGKLRHIRVQYLWVQNVVRRGELAVSKVPGPQNPADVLTKHVDAETMRRHVWRLGFDMLQSRAATAPTLNHLLHLMESNYNMVDEDLNQNEPQNPQKVHNTKNEEIDKNKVNDQDFMN
jgi:hypothetical protein